MVQGCPSDMLEQMGEDVERGEEKPASWDAALQWGSHTSFSSEICKLYISVEVTGGHAPYLSSLQTAQEAYSVSASARASVALTHRSSVCLSLPVSHEVFVDMLVDTVYFLCWQPRIQLFLK